VSKLSKTEQIVAEKTVCILLIRGESPEGKKIYAYVAVRADKLEGFIEAQKKGLFYPEDYGIILESGEGEPAPEVRERMTKEYGFNHDAMVDIPSTQYAHDITTGLAQVAADAKKDDNA